MYSFINGRLIKITAKVGTQSCLEAANTSWTCTNKESLGFHERIMFVRDPIKRLISCFSFFANLKKEGVHVRNFNWACVDSWEVFVDYVLAGNINEHWQPQAEQELFNNEPTATHYLKFDDVNEWFPIIFNTPFPNINASPSVSVNQEYRRSEVDSYYQADHALYDNAMSYNGETVWQH